MLCEDLEITAEEFEAGTGWRIEPRGACRGAVCVPLPAGPFDVRAAAAALGMAVVVDERSGTCALGPASEGGQALTSAIAPELVLPGLDGEEFALSSLRGLKVLVVAWAPW